MKEITRYVASWGDIYVQVILDDGKRMELKFDHDPTFEEIEKIVLAMPVVEDEPPVLIELTVDNAINFLNEKMVEANPLEVAKITEFVSAKAVEIKPIVKEPVLVVK